jgi:hypothetical protein
MLLPQLRYVQVVKPYRGRYLVGVCHRAAFGALTGVTQVLAATGWQINTAFIELVNLTIRQHMATELMDRIWSLQEVLLFCLPPWAQPARV